MRIIKIITALAVTANIAYAQWQYAQPMPTKRSGACVARLDSLIFVMGGSPNGNNGMSDVDIFEPLKNQWSTQTQYMNKSRINAAAAVHEGNIYVFGGRDRGNNVAEIERYDPLNEQWDIIGTMPTPREAFCVEVVDGKIWMIGGTAQNMDARKLIEVFDPATMKWDTVSHQLNIGRIAPVTAQLHGEIYVFGGFFHGPLQSFEKYSWGFGWSLEGNMLFSAGSAGADKIGEELYIVGGQGHSGSPMSSVQVFSPVNGGTWISKPDLQTARKDLAVIAFESVLYTFGGNTSAQFNTPSDVVEYLDVATSISTGQDFSPNPQTLFLSDNYPNPFNGSTKISIYSPTAEKIVIDLYNLAGQRVATLFNGDNRGWNEFVFNFENINGISLSSGVYLLKLSNQREQRVKRVLYIK